MHTLPQAQRFRPLALRSKTSKNASLQWIKNELDPDIWLCKNYCKHGCSFPAISCICCKEVREKIESVTSTDPHDVDQKESGSSSEVSSSSSLNGLPEGVLQLIAAVKAKRHPEAEAEKPKPLGTSSTVDAKAAAKAAKVAKAVLPTEVRCSNLISYIICISLICMLRIPFRADMSKQPVLNPKITSKKHDFLPSGFGRVAEHGLPKAYCCF